jgi:hypothetical protein
MTTALAVIWPYKYRPGTTDTFVSNEVVVKDISSDAIWSLLVDITQWESYYSNCGNNYATIIGPGA